MIGFPNFLVYFVTAAVMIGFEVQAVLLSRLSTAETVLYCAAKVIITLGVLYASIQLFYSLRQRRWGYVVLAVVYILMAEVYITANDFAGRLAVAVNSGQIQAADSKESTALQQASDQKADASKASTDASKRFASSQKRGSVWGQINAAKQASSNADQSADYAAKAADLERNKGVTEQQIWTLVSPLKPMDTMTINAAWFAVVLSLLLALSAGGTGAYLVKQWGKSEPDSDSDGSAPASQADNVVPMPSPAKRQTRQRGRMQVADDTGAVSQAASAPDDSRIPAVSNQLYRPPKKDTARIQLDSAEDTAQDTASVSANGPLTDSEYQIIARAVNLGTDPSVRSLRATYKIGQPKARAVQARLLADGHITQTTGPSGRVLGYKRAA